MRPRGRDRHREEAGRRHRPWRRHRHRRRWPPPRRPRPSAPCATSWAACRRDRGAGRGARRGRRVGPDGGAGGGVDHRPRAGRAEQVLPGCGRGGGRGGRGGATHRGGRRGRRAGRDGCRGGGCRCHRRRGGGCRRWCGCRRGGRGCRSGGGRGRGGARGSGRGSRTEGGACGRGGRGRGHRPRRGLGGRGRWCSRCGGGRRRGTGPPVAGEPGRQRLVEIGGLARRDRLGRQQEVDGLAPGGEDEHRRNPPTGQFGLVVAAGGIEAGPRQQPLGLGLRALDGDAGRGEEEAQSLGGGGTPRRVTRQCHATEQHALGRQVHCSDRHLPLLTSAGRWCGPRLPLSCRCWC